MSDNDSIRPLWMIALILVCTLFCVLILIGLGTVISWLT